MLLTSTSQKFAVQTFCVFVGSPQPWIRSADKNAPITASGDNVPKPIINAAIPEPKPNKFIGPR